MPRLKIAVVFWLSFDNNVTKDSESDAIMTVKHSVRGRVPASQQYCTLL